MSTVQDVRNIEELILKGVCGQNGEILSTDGRRAPRKKVAYKQEKESEIETLLSVNEAAKKCGVSRHRIDDAINNGELAFYPIGERARKIKVSDLKAWIESKRTKCLGGTNVKVD